MVIREEESSHRKHAITTKTFNMDYSMAATETQWSTPRGDHSVKGRDGEDYLVMETLLEISSGPQTVDQQVGLGTDHQVSTVKDKLKSSLLKARLP